MSNPVADTLNDKWEVFGMLAANPTPEYPFDGFLILDRERFPNVIGHVQRGDKPGYFLAVAMAHGVKSPESDGAVDWRGHRDGRFPESILNRLLVPMSLVGKPDWPYNSCTFRRENDQIFFMALRKAEHCKRLESLASADERGGAE